MRRTRAAAALLLVATAAVAACSAGVGGSGAPSAPAGLAGRTFLSTGITGRALVAGSTVRLQFEDRLVTATAGCNTMGGSYTVDSGVLHLGQLSSTEMACDPPLMAQDTWLAGFLDGAGVVLDGNILTLSRDGVTLSLLDRTVADPDRPLEGTRWTVDGLVSGGVVSSVPQGVTATLTFQSGRVSADLGCNSGGADVTVTGTTITFGPMVHTDMACDAAKMGVERAVLAVLQGQAGYAIEAGTLTLTNGAQGLVLHAGQ